MPKIKWTKDNVIAKFQEAMATPEPGTETGPKRLRDILDRAKAKITGKPTEVEETV